MIKLFNDLSNQLEEFKPIDPGKIRMYVCGPTVYDSPHLGHARSAVSFDLIRKYLKYRGFDVKYVMNYTDVDDKMIQRANLRDISMGKLAKQYIDEYEDMQKALLIDVPDVKPRATEEIPEMIAFIQNLEKKGFTYTEKGSVYFDTSKMDGYDNLFQNIKVKAQETVDVVDDGEEFTTSDFACFKKNPKDFVLWKAQKPGEPAWESPWSKGRPGWHIECSTMSMKYLGDTIDIHGGGKDLKRPHHQNEIAQSECATGQTFSNYWIHNGFLNIDDEKMSKSLGNFIPLMDMMKKFSGQLLRYYFITSYYTRPMNFSMDKLEEAQKGLERIQEFFSELNAYIPIPLADIDEAVHENQQQTFTQFLTDFREAMDTDFNSAKAMGHLFSMVKEFSAIIHKKESISQELHSQMIDELTKIDSFFNFIIPTTSALGEAETVWKERFEGLVNSVLELRKKQKLEKQYALADQLRNLLASLGIQVMDEGNDYSWKIA